MIRCIAAIDKKRGLATDQGIPWNLPSDRAYYRHQIEGDKVLFGRATYELLSKPYPNSQNFVATTDHQPLRPGFTKVSNVNDFLTQNTKDDIWILGGAKLFATTIQFAEELYLTRIDYDFHCTKFFPNFIHNFSLIRSTPIKMENNLSFRFEIWRKIDKS